MKPIIFSTPMVQAILSGRKTQTRRVIKPQPNMDQDGWVSISRPSIMFPSLGAFIKQRSPYQPGDILWVRETWQSFFPEEVTEGHQQGPRSFSGIPAETAKGHYMYFYYRADGELENAGEKARWLPSIHMPKEAARIFLQVTGVRVGRVQDITTDDCRLEGCCCSDCLPEGEHSPDCKCDTRFINAWDEINAKRGYGWDKNPWVWVIEFERDESQ